MFWKNRIFRIIAVTAIVFLILISMLWVLPHIHVMRGNAILKAVYAYRLETGSFPKSLDQLIPGFWPQDQRDALSGWNYDCIPGKDIQLMHAIVGRNCKTGNVIYRDDSNGCEWRITATPNFHLCQLIIRYPRPEGIPKWKKKT